MSSSNRPSGLVADKGIELLTGATPNGVKASILLEELKEVYGKDYTWQGIDINTNVQKEDWFIKHGPNGRIPVIIDHDNNDFSLMEGAAILNYLTHKYDPEHRFHFTDPNEIADADQWITWAQSGLAPMQGQAHHFLRYAKEKIPYGIQRYVGETERLYGILDTRLSTRDYVAGSGRGKYSIADIVGFGWVNMAYHAGIDLTTFPNLQAWWERVEARPAVRKGLAIPKVNQSTNREYLRRVKEEAEFGKKEQENKELVKKAKEQYGYVYKSP